MKSYYSYFESEKRVLTDDVDRVLEELDIVGYSVVPGVLASAALELYRKCIDNAWQKQVDEFGEKRLKELGEWGTARALLDYHLEFAELIRHPFVMQVVSKTVGETAILHLMNGSIAFPDTEYHQSKLHRDFAKNFYSDKLLTINAFWTIDLFNSETGGTWFVPFTHKIPYTPSEEYLKKHSVQLEAEAGSVVFFDSRIYHRAGQNRSKNRRRGINFQYTKPFMKQQMDFPALLKDKVDRESLLGQTLGMWTVPSKNLKEFRADPDKRTYKPGQG